MGMTMTQKILARHAGLDHVVPGQLVEGKLDLVLGNDITTPVAISEFNKAGLTRVFDREKIALVLDHYTPVRTSRRLSSAHRYGNLHRSMRSPIFMMWAAWGWSTPFCRKKD